MHLQRILPVGRKSRVRFLVLASFVALGLLSGMPKVEGALLGSITFHTPLY